MARRACLPSPRVSLTESAKTFNASYGTNTRTPVRRRIPKSRFYSQSATFLDSLVTLSVHQPQVLVPKPTSNMPLRSHSPEPENRPHISMQSINNTPIFASLSSHPPAPQFRAESPSMSNPTPSSQTPSSQPAAEFTSDYTSQPTEETPLLITMPAPEIQDQDEGQENASKPFLDRPLWGRSGQLTRRRFLWDYVGELIWLIVFWALLRAIGEVTRARAWGCAKQGFWRMVVKTIFGWPWENGGRCGAWCEGKC